MTEDNGLEDEQNCRIIYWVTHFSLWITPRSAESLCTHRPQGVIIMDIYMSSVSSNIYYY